MVNGLVARSKILKFIDNSTNYFIYFIYFNISIYIFSSRR